MAYATGTTVPVEKTQLEISQMFRKRGASQLAIGRDGRRNYVYFQIEGRMYKLMTEAPSLSDLEKKFKDHRELPTLWGGKRDAWLEAKAEREGMRLWRVLLLLVKAKLTAVDEGHSSIEREFLSDLVLPGGATLHESISSRISEAYLSGVGTPLLGE